MKRTRFLLSLLGLFLFSCLSRNEVRISNRNFGDEIEQQQNLIFTFDKDLVPDSLLNNWDTIPYVNFSPSVKGKFKWNTVRELVFSPAALLQVQCRHEFLPDDSKRHHNPVG